MTQVETVRRDARSYRQGLVLGLTMAEVFLLLVFALLIALASLWHSERQKRKALENQPGQSSMQSAADQRLLEDVRAAIRAASPDRVSKAIDHLRNGRELEPLTQTEKDFVTEVRRQQSGAAPQVISDQWRALTRVVPNVDSLPGDMSVAEAVKRVLLDEKDRTRVIPLIQQGLAAEKNGEHDWPPIIPLNEAKGYVFEKGKAELTTDFETLLRTKTVQEVLDLAQKFGVTTIEVIGHTDEQKIAPRTSNLDASLADIVHNNGNVSTLIPADNAGLGLARATAVVRVLSLDERLKGYTLLPLSGGQLIGVDDRLTKGGGGDERERRRIDIRVRRANISEPSTAAMRSPEIAPAAQPQSPRSVRIQPSPSAPTQPSRSRPQQRVVPRWSPFWWGGT
jgi:flagellar motor protein MotB